MDKNELAGLKRGQFVMYCGETEFSKGFIRGDTFEILEVGNVGFRVYHPQTERRYNITSNMPVQSLNIRNYISVVFPNCESDETELKSTDYEMLIDYALDIKDLDWARELHAAGQTFAV